VQDGQVAGKPGYPLLPQSGERFGDGRAHKPEGGAIAGQPGGVGTAAIQSGCDTGDEGGVVGEPSLHVGDPVDIEAALAQDVLQLVQISDGPGLQSGRLLPDAHIVRDSVAENTGYAREAEPHRTAH